MPKDDLSGQKLDNVSLSGADLSDTDLSRASLRSSQLKGANLQNANLAGSDLHGARLEDANVAGADLSDADLTEAKLDGVNLDEARSVDRARLTGATGISHDLSATRVNLAVETGTIPLVRQIEELNQIIVHRLSSLLAKATDDTSEGSTRGETLEELRALMHERSSIERNLLLSLDTAIPPGT